MKEKLKNKKVVYTIIGIVSVLLVALAVTYAYWLVTRTQEGENVISSACLDITLNGEKNDITLTNQFPMSDEEGMKLVPYEFTVTNNCNTSVDYQVALEATGDEANALKTSSLKVALNDKVSLLSSNPAVDTTISGAYESRKLGIGTLASRGSEGSSKTYTLRIWIDEDAPISEMNKTFRSKISVTIGQTIFNPYKEGTLAYSILARAGGSTAISEISYERKNIIVETGNEYTPLSFEDYYATDYTLDESTGLYTLSGTLTQARVDECRSGTKTCGKYTLSSQSPTDSSGTLMEVLDFQSSGEQITVNRIQYLNEFSVSPTEVGIFKTQDDYGTSYYFRGNVSNNYVQFGTYQEDGFFYYRPVDTSGNGPDQTFETLEECNDAWGSTPVLTCTKYGTTKGDSMYWRIVRINGDGTIRLVYDGTTKVENGTNHAATIANTEYNINTNNKKYVGYTYDDDGTQVNSTIKGVVDAWYEKHLKTVHEDKIADTIFCNDREVVRTNNNDIYYGAYDRLNNYISNIYRHILNPSLKCSEQKDRYTVNDRINGNGHLSNPIGLITADEVVFAGGLVDYGSNYYLNSGESYWTSAPYYWNGIGGYASVWYVRRGDLGSNNVYSENGARPVINLKADVLFEGDGSYDTPYVIK